ncbi:MAG: hypothetical protein LC114_02780, partial [Bryobacterales bacterium]|nr:hypothetical protein [Bryobacterales bacterium]
HLACWVHLSRISPTLGTWASAPVHKSDRSASTATSISMAKTLGQPRRQFPPRTHNPYGIKWMRDESERQAGGEVIPEMGHAQNRL